MKKTRKRGGASKWFGHGSFSLTTHVPSSTHVFSLYIHPPRTVLFRTDRNPFQDCDAPASFFLAGFDLAGLVAVQRGVLLEPVAWVPPYPEPLHPTYPTHHPVFCLSWSLAPARTQPWWRPQASHPSWSSTACGDDHCSTVRAAAQWAREGHLALCVQAHCVV